MATKLLTRCALGDELRTRFPTVKASRGETRKQGTDIHRKFPRDSVLLSVYIRGLLLLLPLSWPSRPLSGRLRFLDSLRSLGMTPLYRDGCDSSTRYARSE